MRVVRRFRQKKTRTNNVGKNRRNEEKKSGVFSFPLTSLQGCRQNFSRSLLRPVGGPLPGDRLEAGLDGLDRAFGVAGHALEEEEARLLVQDGVRRAAGVAGHVLLFRGEQERSMMMKRICLLVSVQ